MDNMQDEFSKLKKKEKIQYLENRLFELKKTAERNEKISPKLISFLKQLEPNYLLYFIKVSSSFEINRPIIQSDELCDHMIKIWNNIRSGQKPSCYLTDGEFETIAKERNLPPVKISQNEILITGKPYNLGYMKVFIAEEFCVLYVTKHFGEDHDTVERWGEAIVNAMEKKMVSPELRLDYLFQKYEVIFSKNTFRLD
jgi:hypothetical protein